MSPVIERHYNFPPIDEDVHRFTRMTGAIIAICVAILPFFLNFVWRIFAIDGKRGISQEILESGFTDLALAGVVLAVSTFTNTYFSAKLLGWQSISRSTFVALLFVTLSSIFSFVAYLESANGYIDEAVKLKAFGATILMVLACIFWSIVAHYCFLEDEFRYAKENLRRIPNDDISDKWL
jgi:hypothetical protein